MNRDLQQEPEVLQPQIIILNWFFTRYHAHMDPRYVIRYEGLVAAGGRVLSACSGTPTSSAAP